MKNLFVSDAHCDTIGEMEGKLNLFENSGQLDLKRITEYEKWLQIFAVWTNPKEKCEFIRKRFFESSDKLFTCEKDLKDLFCVAKSGKEIEQCVNTYKCTGILAVEGGEIIGKDIDYIDVLYDRGVKVITLTWNYDNYIGCGAETKDDTGLTEFGKSVVKKMNEKSIVIDVSHASEKTFWHVAEESKKAIMASHSNAKALCGHKRNLSYEQIKQIIDMNGFVGINFYPPFLTESGEAKLSDVICHIEYFMSLGAEDVLGLGSDFDGIDYAPKGLCGVQQVYKIAESLLKLNYSEDAVLKIMGKNLYNFLIREIN